MSRLSCSFFIALFLLVAGIGFAATAHAVQLKDHVDVPSGYKSCHTGLDCIVTLTSCPGYNVCCEYDAINQMREKDYGVLNEAQCKQGQYKKGVAQSELQTCTICEPLSSHASECINNVCVRKKQ